MMKSQLPWCLVTLLGALAIGLPQVAVAGKASIALDQPAADQARFGRCLTIDGREMFMLAPLPNRDVLVAGGLDDKTEKHALASAAICDPSTGRLTPVGNMVFARCCASATVLRDGQVLIAGGTEKPRINSLKTAEVYNPAGREFERVGDMNEPRAAHSATLLNDGRVLIVDGSRGARSAELYDPITRSFTPTGSMQGGRSGPHAELLRDGSVLICDGWAGSHRGIMPYQPPGCDLYTPALGTFTYVEDKSKLPPR